MGIETTQLPIEDQDYVPYDTPRTGYFLAHFTDGLNPSKGSAQIIGENSHVYVTGLVPFTPEPFGPPVKLICIGIHKSRLIKWLPTQLEIF